MGRAARRRRLGSAEQPRTQLDVRDAPKASFVEGENLQLDLAGARTRVGWPCARACASASARNLYARWGVLGVGVALRGEQRQWHLLGAREWYDRHRRRRPLTHSHSLFPFPHSRLRCNGGVELARL
ncbi:hypothetical protein NB693_23195 [Pantoea ananatis]|uniref:hypothetical protein n=1 Tax=Pantoea ananas TaxID=553 RepID=UPI0022201731|nr:hypothetical protein [Pantoea ananatis]